MQSPKEDMKTEAENSDTEQGNEEDTNETDESSS